MFFIRWLYSGLNWVLLWKGSELIVDILNRFVPWVESPLKRLIASVMGIFLVVFLVVWGLDIFFDTLFLGKTLSQALEASSAPYVNVLVVTLIVNVFMHGRGFLLGWRQASIDMERLKIEQISTRYESLKNQVNPHFLFNSLNALSSLVYDDQAKAVEFIRRLSQVYRYVLDKREQELVTVDEELTFAQDFIFLQKIRFGENLQVTISNEEKEKGFLPPLALQLLVENAIKFTPTGSITLRIERLDARSERADLRFSVIDTGIGIPIAMQQTIFRPFQQVEEEQQSNDGVGLGLAISRHLVHAFGGQ
ncbi:MAG: histidine kinase, partial [Bacteroidota bacterium]